MDRKQDEVVSVLLRARKLIETPDRWAQAKIPGSRLTKVDEVADRRCVGMAIDDAGAEQCGVVATLRLLFKSAIDCEHVEKWNDAPERTHAEVLAALDQAIALRVAEIA